MALTSIFSKQGRMLHFASVVNIFVELRESQILQEVVLKTAKKYFKHP